MPECALGRGELTGLAGAVDVCSSANSLLVLDLSRNPGLYEYKRCVSPRISLAVRCVPRGNSFLTASGGGLDVGDPAGTLQTLCIPPQVRLPHCLNVTIHFNKCLTRKLLSSGELFPVMGNPGLQMYNAFWQTRVFSNTFCTGTTEGQLFDSLTGCETPRLLLSSVIKYLASKTDRLYC